MALVKPDTARIARIKVVGVGGGGSNAVSSMLEGDSVSGVEFIAVNTDAQVLLQSKVPTKIQIGEKLTRGLGVGGRPDLGAQAAEESIEKLKELFVESDMVFVTAGMGGGTGTGAAPILAKQSKEAGALTVAIVTKPFVFEGTRRMITAEEGIEKLSQEVDTLIVIPNQRLMDVVDKKMTLIEAFRVADSVLGQAVSGIADIITTPGLVNVDFADIKTIMKDAGTALLGIGVGVGENRAQMAARAAISSPLLDLSMDGARGVLFNIAGGEDLTMFEVDEAANIISHSADPDANIIFGAVIKEELTDQIRITVVATGFDETRARIAQMSKTSTREEVQGLIGEKIVEQVTTQEKTTPTELGKKEEEKEDEEEPPEEPKSEDDSFGEKFEIPAFLRRLQ